MSHSQQQSATGPIPTAPDSPAMGVTVSGNVTKYAMKKKKILNAEESELFELTQAAGIAMDQEVFKIIVDLLKMNVAPLAVFQTLKAMCAGQRIVDTSMGDTASFPNTTTTTASAAPTEPREEESVVPGTKSSKPTAPPPTSSSTSSTAGPRPTRINPKMAYDSSPHSQVRSKASAGHGEKSREGSSQRVPRQPSATRGQKTTKSSGSSSSSSQITPTATT
ncbi:mitotic-spindle organizing protein 2 isoform X1 [Esox lucius]|uniref:Mitotic-spindle organizing protein 2 n=1 Tax=Esox lucius TaxID=8010 RepID=A0A3P8ZGE4_ESOLU|nr:mitotic-spindle organizing protein 2 isoform X1 [Esox lucius]XP_010862395.1 mitotic-spindle organizing protein 2 isoform X1 [Esox lucius]